MTTIRIAAGVLVLVAGCAAGGRLTGGVLAGDRGVSGFVTATFELGVIDGPAERLTAELGETDSDRRPATHVGVRFEPARPDRTAWTASAAVETSPDGGFGRVSFGASIIEPTTDHTTPDVLAGHWLGAAVEGVVVVGGRRTDAAAAAVGVQLSVEVLELAIMR